MSVRERLLELPHLQLAAREWGPDDGLPVLALHGWLDNAASFERLAPLLPELHVVALDLPGHGRSQHRPPGVVHHFIDWVPEVVAVADELGWDRFSILGHSMGAGIGSLVPAIFPERIERLILLEGLGPVSAPAEDTPQHLVSALADEARLAAARPRIFPDLDHAAAARARDTDVDLESARLLVERGTEVVGDGVCFTYDPRLRTRSRLRLTEEHVFAFLSAIPCPVIVVRARDGWPVPEDMMAARLAAIPRHQVVEVEGGHHVHLTDPERVAPLVQGFFRNT
jgi:pimeloyl-ACP methyl ester carboxylesterase